VEDYSTEPGSKTVCVLMAWGMCNLWIGLLEWTTRLTYEHKFHHKESYFMYKC